MRKRFIRIIFIAVLCIVPVWMIFSKDRTFSDNENRYLSSFPKITFASIMDGSFMEDFETYMTDQFPARDACIVLKTNSLRLMGRKEMNGVYLGEGGYLIAGENEFDADRAEEIMNSVNTFADSLEGVNVKFMAVPDSISIYEDKLPYGVKSTQKSMIDAMYSMLSDKVDKIDIYDTLYENRTQKLYYKTDHHWTVEGAYLAFKEFASAEGLTVNDSDYETYCVASGFKGTQASNSGVYTSDDVVNICVPKESEGTYVVNYVEDTRKTTTLFDEEKLKEKDKYLVFMGGNYSQVNIATTAGTGKNLLIIKDSFANCFVPMLTPYYDNIIVVDPRYFYDDIYEAAKRNSITDVLFLYSVNSIVKDNSLADVLEPDKM